MIFFRWIGALILIFALMFLIFNMGWTLAISLLIIASIVFLMGLIANSKKTIK